MLTPSAELTVANLDGKENFVKGSMDEWGRTSYTYEEQAGDDPYSALVSKTQYIMTSKNTAYLNTMQILESDLPLQAYLEYVKIRAVLEEMSNVLFMKFIS